MAMNEYRFYVLSNYGKENVDKTDDLPFWVVNSFTTQLEAEKFVIEHPFMCPAEIVEVKSHISLGPPVIRKAAS